MSIRDAQPKRRTAGHGGRASARGDEPAALATRGTGARDLAIPPELVAAARSYAAAATAPATRRGYASDWRQFEAWCKERQLLALPAEVSTVALYLSARAEAGRKTATIRRQLAAISKAHRAKGRPTPCADEAVQSVMRGIARKLGTVQVQKLPLLPRALRDIAALLPQSIHGARDRALLLLGFAGAFRRSELVQLDVADVAFTDVGLEVTLRRSKTDQEGAGLKKAIPPGTRAETCPMRAVKAWVAAANITAGPLFRRVTRHGAVGSGRLSSGSVGRIVKRAVALAGLDIASYSGHSLRAGLITAAVKAGKPESAIMHLSGHRSVASFRRYVRFADPFAQALSGIGL